MFNSNLFKHSQIINIKNWTHLFLVLISWRNLTVDYSLHPTSLAMICSHPAWSWLDYQGPSLPLQQQNCCSNHSSNPALSCNTDSSCTTASTHCVLCLCLCLLVPPPLWSPLCVIHKYLSSDRRCRGSVGCWAWTKDDSNYSIDMGTGRQRRVVAEG